MCTASAGTGAAAAAAAAAAARRSVSEKAALHLRKGVPGCCQVGAFHLKGGLVATAQPLPRLCEVRAAGLESLRVSQRLWSQPCEAGVGELWALHGASVRSSQRCTRPSRLGLASAAWTTEAWSSPVCRRRTHQAHARVGRQTWVGRPECLSAREKAREDASGRGWLI